MGHSEHEDPEPPEKTLNYLLSLFLLVFIFTFQVVSNCRVLGVNISQVKSMEESLKQAIIWLLYSRYLDVYRPNETSSCF